MHQKKLTHGAVIGAVAFAIAGIYVLKSVAGPSDYGGGEISCRERRLSRLRFHLRQMENAQPPSEETPRGLA